MKLIIKHGFDEEDYRARLEITGLSKKLEFFDGESEDNSLGRNFSDCYSIGTLIKEANQLGLQGIQLEIEEIEDNDIYDY